MTMSTSPASSSGNGSETSTPFTLPARRIIFGGIDWSKLLLLAVAYSGTIVVAHWLAYLIRFEFHPPIDAQNLFWRTLQWALPVELGFLYVFGQFRSLLSYFSFPDANRIVFACAATGTISLGVWYATDGAHAPPRSIILLSFLLDTVGLIYVRVSFRKLREWQRGNGESGRADRRIAIFGAGDVGANLAKELLSRPDLGLLPVAFFDDNPAKWKMRIHGVPVLGRPELLVESKTRADEAVFAMPSAPGRRLREIVQVLSETHLRFSTVPSVEQMVNGTVRVSQIRPVELEDLLGRETINLQADRIRELVRGKVVMVTGAGGSIGSELCRQIASYSPRQLLLVERSEFLLFQIEQELIDLGLGSNITPLVVNITDPEQTGMVFRRFAPTVIFHAAAHKHVPMMEQQPAEAFANNTLGTRLLANLALTHNVERFVLISTDKAINPTNVMGATKRMAELYLQALQMEIRNKELGAAPLFAAANPVFVLGSGASSVAKPRQKGREKVIGSQDLQAEGQWSVDGRQKTEDRSQNPAPHTSGLTPPSAALPLTKFMAVRFGNVLGSSGSVIPTFKKQIAAGGPVTVTHPEMTRYFMTVNEAVGLVLQSATLGEGGEIFVLDMGQPMKIVDLARQLIELSGLNPDTDIEIRFTGLRPGEKLFEELNHNTENMTPTSHAKIMRFIGAPQPLDHLQAGLAVIQTAAATQEAAQVKLAIKALVPEYEPHLGVR
jgi:FlaA1/EpsC-like NDP-sugar epimerase